MPGIKPQEKVNRTWSPHLAYAIGLISTDGNLSPDGRHLILVSKDGEQLRNFLKCLGIENKISRRRSSGFSNKFYKRVQFGDVLFYRFLIDIGLTPRKSKILGELKIPKKYFFDFLRGVFDGDGTFFSYYDPRWKSSFMFYTCFVSGSRNFLDWLRQTLFFISEVKGHITYGSKNTYMLKYAKKESLKVLRGMYYKSDVVCLSRKRLKIEKALNIVDTSLSLL